MPGWHVSGSIEATVTAGGETLIVVNVAAPANELVRDLGQDNLLWQLETGTCNVVVAASAPPVHRLPYRVLALGGRVERTAPDGELVRFQIDAPAAVEPLSLAAFVDGGGPMVACGDVPANNGGAPRQLPASGDHPRASADWLALAGVVLTAFGLLLRRRCW